MQRGPQLVNNSCDPAKRWGTRGGVFRVEEFAWVAMVASDFIHVGEACWSRGCGARGARGAREAPGKGQGGGRVTGAERGKGTGQLATRLGNSKSVFPVSPREHADCVGRGQAAAWAAAACRPAQPLAAVARCLRDALTPLTTLQCCTVSGLKGPELVAGLFKL